jgi:hypothetical protein
MVRLDDPALELSTVLCVDQANRATAETASGQARTIDASLTIGNLNHDLQFRTTDLIVIAQAAM